MKIIIYTADCSGDAANCIYPHMVEAANPAELAEAVSRDHVGAKYKDSYRKSDNFEEATVIEMDVDNDHTDAPEAWITPEKLAEDEELRDVDFATTPSRHNMQPKGNKSARPRFHFHAPISRCVDPEEIASLKQALYKKYTFFDGNALDASRFMFGSEVREDEVFWHEGFMTVDEIFDDAAGSGGENIPTGGSILEGSRNNTMSHFAGRVLKKYGETDKAHGLFLERAEKCEPPLPESELSSIWRSAVKFYRRIQGEDGYVPPEEYNNDFGVCRLKPDDYSDIGEARVLAAECGDALRFTSATEFLAFGGDCWYESKEKALGMVEAFLDAQLSDALEAVAAAEDALVAAGIDKDTVRGGGKELSKAAGGSPGLLQALVGAVSYQKFVMRYRNYKNIVNTMNAVKPMVAIDISEFD